MPQAAQKRDFLLEALHNAVGGGVPGVEEDGVQYFSCADELVALGSVHRSIGAYPERVLLCLDEMDVTEPEVGASVRLRHWETVDVSQAHMHKSRPAGSPKFTWYLCYFRPCIRTEGRVSLQTY